MVEITAVEQNIEKRMTRSEDCLRDLWDNTKHTNIHITGGPEGKEREKVAENVFDEIIAENFHNMGKVIINQDIINLEQRVPGRINQEGTYPVA